MRPTESWFTCAVLPLADAPAPDIQIEEGTKAVINDPAVVATAEKVLKAAFGDKIRATPPGTPSEDYSEFVNAGVPSMFFNIGVYEPERVRAAMDGAGPALPSNHSPQFAPDREPSLKIGMQAFTVSALELLQSAGD